jgi:hypothetical protein
MFNTPFKGWQDVQKLLKKAYSPIFHRIVFTGFKHVDNPPEDETWVKCDANIHGIHMYKCFANVMQEIEAPPTGGYFFVGDDAIFAHCMIKDMDKGKIWYNTDLSAKAIPRPLQAFMSS